MHFIILLKQFPNNNSYLTLSMCQAPCSFRGYSDATSRSPPAIPYTLQ